MIGPAWRRVGFAVPLVLFGALAVYLALGLGRDPSVIPSVLINRPVPSFVLAPLPSFEPGFGTVDLANGRPQLVNVFASWCGPCRVEHPLLMRMARELGVTIRGINYKDHPDAAVAWLRRYGNPYQSIGRDEDGRVAIEWGVYGVPETFVIDGTGQIRYKHVGPLTAADVEEKIMPIMRELQGWQRK